MPRRRFAEDYERLREMLAEARAASGLTQAQVARRLGRSQSFVSKYEMGERRIDLIEFLALAEVLGLDAGHAIRTLQPRIRRKLK